MQRHGNVVDLIGEGERGRGIDFKGDRRLGQGGLGQTQFDKLDEMFVVQRRDGEIHGKHDLIGQRSFRGDESTS